MKVHYLQHVPFENPGNILPYLHDKGTQIHASHLYNANDLPDVNDFDLLIVMGGPMGIYEDAEYPWLAPEKALIKAAIDAGKKVLGICLGAQLIADVMGATVTKNVHREIGWFDITPSSELSSTILADTFPQLVNVFHWHSDTFTIPDGAIPVASSDACKNQGFIYENRVIALQFHLEITQEGASSIINNCRDELDGSIFVQNEGEILANSQNFETI
ncbi:MAG: Glutamine amidotransferase class-I (EC, partial [uncultured Thiotrichaceae bacterium]